MLLAVTAAAGPALFLFVFLARRLRANRPRLRAAHRRRQALHHARRDLVALDRQTRRDPAAIHRHICATLRRYLADRLGVPAAAMMPEDAHRLLLERGVPDDVARRFHADMEHHVNTGFETAEASLNPGDVDRTIQTLTAIERALGSADAAAARGSSARVLSVWLIPFLGLGLLASAAGAATPAEREFVWNEANARMMTAHSASDYLRCAETYQNLVDLDVRNDSLFFNLGTALLGAERYDDAARAFLRAERYSGSAPDITRNLLIARAKQEKLKAPVLTWDRVVLFWHYGLSCSTRGLIAAAAFSLFWIGLAVRLTGRTSLARAVLILSLLGIALFGSSALTTLHQESDARRPVLAPAATPNLPR